MRKMIRVFSVIFVVLLTGCVSFQRNPEMNKGISGYWSDRDYIPIGKVGPNNGELTSYIARVTYKGGDGKWHVSGRPIVKGSAQWKVLTDATSYYTRSIFDSNYGGNTNLPAVTLELKADSAYDYEIRDVAHVIVPSENTPDRATIVAEEGLPSGVPLYWIRAAGLTTVKFTSATAISSGGTITGVGFGSGAKVYNAASLAEFYPLISIDVIPMNGLADAQIAAKPTAPSKGEAVAGVGAAGAAPSSGLFDFFARRDRPSPVAARPSNEPKSIWKAKLTDGTGQGSYLKFDE